MKKPNHLDKTDKYVNIPTELKQLRQWVYCKLVPKENGKINKVPYTPMTDKEAASTRKSSWGTFDMAVLSVQDDPENRAIAFILDYTYVVIDLDMDGCIDPITNKMNDLSRLIVEEANSYTEKSNSGKGIHVVMKGYKPGSACKNVEMDIEMYQSERVMVFTGDQLSGFPSKLSEDQNTIDSIYSKYFKHLEKTEEIQDSDLPELSDEIVLKLLKRDKKAWIWWNTKCKKGDDQSSFDMKLMMKLAYFTRKKSKQCERLFGQSELGQRDKWTKREKYRKATIQKAFAGLSEVYQGDGSAVAIEYPDVTDKGFAKNTIENLEALMEALGYKVRYNVIALDFEITHGDYQFSTMDGGGNSALSRILSDCARYNMPKDNCAEYVKTLGRENPYNPVQDWIESEPWDGTKRIDKLSDTIQTRGDFPKDLKDLLLRKWLISAVNLALNDDGREWSKGVLVMQGHQSAKKTKWFTTLVPPEKNEWLQDGATIDVKNNDSKKEALIRWIVELGELDATLKKDLEQLKGWLTRRSDTMRQPYDRVHSTFPRRTVFFASVNPSQFLKDDANVRFWTIPVKSLDVDHGIDMQQLWAEVHHYFKQGELWYLSDEEEADLEKRNEDNRIIDPIEDMFKETFMEGELKIVPDPKEKIQHMQLSTKDVFKILHRENYNKWEATILVRLLTEKFGESTRPKNGVKRWDIPVDLLKRNGVKIPASDDIPVKTKIRHKTG
jgi:hypothetical protein